jgi:hypothetical protein
MRNLLSLGCTASGGFQLGGTSAAAFSFILMAANLSGLMAFMHYQRESGNTVSDRRNTFWRSTVKHSNCS